MKLIKFVQIFCLLALFSVVPFLGFAAETMPIPPIPTIPGVNGSSDGRVSMLLQLVFALTFITFVPVLIMVTTSFTRIMIVFSFLRMAMGTQSAPPNMVVVFLSLLLTFFIMKPVFMKISDDALIPYVTEQISFKDGITRAVVPMREFMIRNTRTNDFNMFITVSRETPKTIEDVSFITLTCAFITSELRTAFEIGLLLYLPFLIIDFAVSSILLAMGMMMLPPAMVSMPFKLMLFILVDGWDLIISSLFNTFY